MWHSLCFSRASNEAPKPGLTAAHTPHDVGAPEDTDSGGYYRVPKQQLEKDIASMNLGLRSLRRLLVATPHGGGTCSPAFFRSLHEWSAPQLIRRWRRRSWIEFVFRILKHLLATESCQVHNEDAYYGHLVLRLMGSFILFYTSRVICKGRLTMEEIIFSLKHYWRFVDLEALGLQPLS